MTCPAQVLPHRPPMLLLEAIQEVDDRHCTALVKVDPQAWYAAANGSAPGWFGLEWMAQTISAYSGHQNQGQGRPPKLGYLLGTRQFQCDWQSFPAGATLEVEAQVHYADPGGLSAFQCEIRHQGVQIARAILKVYEP